MTKSKIDPEMVRRMYQDDLADVAEIAAASGCGVANIRRILKRDKVRRGKEFIRSGKKPSWNKGLSKDTDERLARISEARSGDGNPMAGRDAWNKGLTKADHPSLQAVSDKLRLRPISDEHREAMAEAKRGRFLEESNAWKGGARKINSAGYMERRITRDGRRWYEHRWVATQALGRELLSHEEVHHIDRDRRNNDPSNLIVLTGTDHNALHRAIDEGFESKEQQIAWLRTNNITFEVCYAEDHQRHAAE